MSNTIYKSKIIAHNDPTLTVRQYDKTYIRKNKNYTTPYEPKPLNDDDKQILDIDLKIKSIINMRELDKNIILINKNNELYELERLKNFTNTEGKIILSHKKKLVRIKYKEQLEQIISDAREEIDVLKQNKASILNKNKKKRAPTTITKKSLKRSKTTLLTLVRNNKDVLTTFITLTFRENVVDLDYANDCLKKFISRSKYVMKESGKKLCYICVPEFQKRGAVHYHMLTNIEVGSKLIPKRKPKKTISEGKLITMEYYNLTAWRSDDYDPTNPDDGKNYYGFSTAYKIESKNDLFDVGKYMVKYLTKGFNDKDNNRLFGRQKILRSQNLKKPKEEYTDEFKKIYTITTDLEDKLTSKYWHEKKSRFDCEFIEHEYTFDSIKERDEYLKSLNNEGE